MSEEQKVFLEEFDKRYTRMQTLLVAIISVILAAVLGVGVTQISSAASVKSQTERNTDDIKYIMDNSTSQKAIDRLIVSFENQTDVMVKYLPEDVQGAIKEFNKTSSELRQNIIYFNSDLNNRGAE